MTQIAPHRVLIISKDPTLLENRAGFGDTLKRHIYYAERLSEQVPGSELCILTYSKKTAPQQFLSPSSNIKIFGTASAHRALFLIDALRRMRTLTADGWKPTVITTQEPYEDGQLGLWLARRYHARFIPQLHFDMFSGDWLKESFLNPVRRRVAGKILRRADAIRVVSQEQKRQLISRLNLKPESIYVVPVGVSFRPTAQTKDNCKAAIDPALPEHKVVLFVGRLYAQKNMQLWINVAERVLAQAPTTRFLIAGDGPLQAEIKTLVESKGISAAITFLGNVPYQNLSEIYGAADLFLLTSHYEGFGRVIVEANLARLPVVATICTGPEDIVVDGETGYLCGKNDLPCLTERVLALLTNDSKRQQFAEAAHQHVERLFSREHLADSLVKMWISR